MKLASTSMKS